jgi:hypothetical protein
MNIFIDLETIPSQNPDVKAEFLKSAQENIKAPSTLTKEQAAIDLGITDKDEIKFTSKDSMLAKWVEVKGAEAAVLAADEAWRKTSFDGGLGHICVIGWAIDDEPTQSISCGIADICTENIMLETFSNIINKLCAERPNERPRFIGHNLIEFDLQFLFRRHVVLGVKPSPHIPFNARPWDDSVYDTMQKWGGQRGNSLDKITKACGIEGKGDIDGSMVWDYVRDGRIIEVADYCKHDVEITRNLYKRMTFQ